MNLVEIYEYFSKIDEPLILDGAMGSLIEQRGYKLDNVLWTSLLNTDNPEVIIDLHQEYIKAGCDIITTNTFRTNPHFVNLSNKISDYNDFIKRSVTISKNVAVENNVLLAGSNPPAEDCYQKKRTLTKEELINNHHRHIDMLYNNGVDFILNETQSHLDEIIIISEYCSKNSIPYIISLYFDANLKILSGEHLNEVITLVKSYNPLLISVNCITQNVFAKYLNDFRIDFNWGYYLSCGQMNSLNGKIVCELDPGKYIDIIKSSLNLKPKMIGACCGSNHEFIKNINNLLHGKTNSKRTR